MSKSISLEQSLQAYRVMNTPTELSWKTHWANEVFTNDNYLECSDEEKEQFDKRLDEGACTICDSIKLVKGRSTTLKELVSTIVDPKNKDITKVNRKVIYSTANGERPIGKKAFEIWNGFQVIDMDIKDATMSQKLKPWIFEHLKKCNWFLGVTLSSSGKGLHVYTKISIPESEENDEKKKKVLFLTNFRHKYSFVYIVCINGCERFGYTKDDVLKWMDLAMFKPQQGAFIGYDPAPLISTHYFEDFIYVNFDNDDFGGSNTDWMTYPDLKEIFKRWEWFEDEEEDLKIEVKEANDLEFDTHNKVHYKHNDRWRLANTLVKLYGMDKGYRYLRMICSNAIRDKELQADCITASRHDKPVDVWAVNKLNTQHGFKIKLNIQSEQFDETEIYKSIDNIDNPTIIHESPFLKCFHISSKQYLGNIKWELLNNLGRITLIEAGAGVGKTEMVKSLVRDGKKVVLVMPFTSTIKSKVEGDKDWLYAYGNHKVRLDQTPGVALTIDKFSRLNLMDIKAMGFDYIIIDESHLMFQSEYRPVMSKVVEMIRNTEVPIILMSGTPSGELVFFPDIVHLNSSKIGMMGRLVFKPSRIVYTVHGFDSMRKTYRKLLFIEKLLKGRASAIVGVCKYDYDALLEEGITQHVSYIHNAVPDTMNSPMETDEELSVSQEMLKLHKQYGKLLMCIARDAKPKRLDMFFDLAKANPHYGFVWIGNKNEYEDKPANVYMLGSLQNASKYLRYVDLSVLISDYEGFPMSILESLSYGVPVVASNVGGVAELLNGKNGLIAENNLEDWSAKINQALNDACLEDMSKEARKSYEQHFTIEKMVSAYDEIYNQMINRK